MTDKMDLWRSVEKTDPDHTKRVNQRGGFTSIGAHYQVMRATETFGPVGIGWGYECGEPIFHGPFIMIPVKLWYRDRANTFGPIYGCAEIMGNKPDHDAPKKAMTDALTKALSHLGFNADVFLGRFDDNKYVEELKAEKAAASKPKPDDSAVQEAVDCFAKADTLDAANGIWRDLPAPLKADQRVIDAAKAAKARNKPQVAA